MLCAQSSAQRAVVINGASYSFGVIGAGEMEMVPLRDVVEKLTIRFFENVERRKIELRGMNGQVKFTAGSPFVVLEARAGDTVVVLQMPRAVQFAQGAYYVHWISLVRLLKQEFGKSIAAEGKPEMKINPVRKDTILPKPVMPVLPVVKDTSAGILPGTGNLVQLIVDEKANGTLVRISMKQKIRTSSAVVSLGKLILSLTPAFPVIGKLPVLSKTSVIKKVNSSVSDTGGTIIIELGAEYASHELMKVNDNNLQLVIQNKKFTPAQTDPKKDKWKFDAIVIDAGHGGKDYGAIGVNSTVEKTINLAVALKFGALVRQHLPDVRVIYTRDDDTFIELYRRGKIANENNGKLFISIHSNAVPGRSNSATGYEIYLLRPGRTDEAISIAARENSVISYEDNPNRYQKLTDENLILVSMAHASYMKYSEQFADLLDRHLSETVPLKSRGVKQAGFYVLVGASMPSVLFETGYVTNSKDADYLKSESGQDQLANALFQAVQSFKAYYTKEIEGE